MSPIQQNLERSYQLFIDRDKALGFFQGLAEYMEYVLTTPALKSTVDSHIAERDAGYAKVDALEKDIFLEVETAKKKILKVVKDKKLDPKTFRRIGPDMPGMNPVEELEAYETGGLSKSGWRSDNTMHYLFEIAANIKSAGHEDAIKEYVFSNDDYETYYRRANESAIYLVIGNENGNFIFSSIWPDRVLAENLIKKERKLKPWGAFEALLCFKRAFDTVSRGGNFGTILQENAPTPVAVHDAVEAAFMAEDIQTYMGDGWDTYRSRALDSVGKTGHLEQDKFKVHIQTLHSRLLQGLATTHAPAILSTQFDAASSRLHVKGENVEIRRVSDQYDLLRVIFEEQQEIGKEWFFDEIADKVDAAQSGKRNKKYYNAAYQINRKLAEKGLKNFFILNAHSAKITPHYLA